MTNEDQKYLALEAAGLNWEVQKEPLYLSGNVKTPFHAIVRQDTRDIFTSKKDRYEVFQNSEMMDLAFKISEETGYEFDTACSYGEGGARVSIDLKGPETNLTYKKVGDVVKNSFRITNSHDGTGSLKLALGTLVLSCTNGMTRWVDDKKVSVRHTTNMRGLIDKALVAMEVITEDQRLFELEIKRMLETSLKPKDKDNMIHLVTGVNMKEVNRNDWTSDTVATRSLNRAKALNESFLEEMSVKGHNVWGLLNGVTHFTTHKSGRDSTREESKIFGQLMGQDEKAYKQALSLVYN